MVTRRRMARRYRDDPVDPGAVRRIAEAVRRGPSAGFAQGVSVVVVTDPDRRRAVAALAGEAEWVRRGREPWLSVAPVHLVLCVEPSTYRRRYEERDKEPSALSIPWWWVDGGAALMLVLLAAVDEGLAAGFLGGHALPAVGDLLGIPEAVEVLGVVTIGHSVDPQPPSSASRGRRPSGEVIRIEHW